MYVTECGEEAWAQMLTGWFAVLWLDTKQVDGKKVCV